jgi:hypothetical protein
MNISLRNLLQNRKRCAWAAGGLLSALVVSGYFLLPGRPEKLERSPSTQAANSGASSLPQLANANIASSPCTARRQDRLWRVDCAKATLENLSAVIRKESGVNFSYPPALAAYQISVVADALPMDRILDIALSPFNFIVTDTGSGSSQYSSVVVVGLKDFAAQPATQTSSEGLFAEIWGIFDKSANTSPLPLTPSPFGSVDSKAVLNSAQQQSLPESSQAQPEIAANRANLNNIPSVPPVEAARIVDDLKRVTTNARPATNVPTAAANEAARIVGELNRVTARPPTANVPLASQTEAARIVEELKLATTGL